MIALDTSALIWAVKGVRSQGYAYSAQMDAIKGLGGPVILPAPALAEYLVKIPVTARADALNLLSETVWIQPFDMRAALLAADLLGSPAVRKRRGSRREFKIDAMILAVALAQNARVILSEDGDYESLVVGTNIKLERPSKIRAQTVIPAPV